MTSYSVNATMFDGGTIGAKGPFTALQAYEKAATLRGQGCHSIVLIDVETGNRIDNVEKLLPYPDL